MKSAFEICCVPSGPKNELCRTSDQRDWLHCQTELGSNETQNYGLWLLLHLTTLVKHVLDLMGRVIMKEKLVVVQKKAVFAFISYYVNIRLERLRKIM